jgi:phage-related protein
MHTMTPMFTMCKDRHMEKLKRVMRHIKLISMKRRLFLMHFEVHKAVQCAVDLHHDSYVAQVHGQAHGEGQHIIRMSN